MSFEVISPDIYKDPLICDVMATTPGATTMNRLMQESMTMEIDCIYKVLYAYLKREPELDDIKKIRRAYHENMPDGYYLYFGDVCLGNIKHKWGPTEINKGVDYTVKQKYSVVFTPKS